MARQRDDALSVALHFAAAVWSDRKPDAAPFPCPRDLLSSPDWREGLCSVPSRMDRAPAWHWRFPASIREILPPAPHLAYATDAVVDADVHVFDEAYFPACGPRWRYIVKEDTEKTSSENGVVGPFVDVGHPAGLCLQSRRLSVPRARQGGLPGAGALRRAVPRHGRGVAPHTPSLDEISSEGEDAKENYATLPFSFYFGCNDTSLQRKLFMLVRIDDPSLFVGSGPAFAREVIVPTAGHSLAPLLNYMELTSLRRRVERLHGVASPGPRRLALVLARSRQCRPSTPKPSRGGALIPPSSFDNDYADGGSSDDGYVKRSNDSYVRGANGNLGRPSPRTGTPNSTRRNRRNNRKSTTMQ